MAVDYDENAAKRPVDMSPNEDLVAKARQPTGNLSEQVGRVLADFAAAKQNRRLEEEGVLRAAARHWNQYDAKQVSFEYIDL